MMCAYSRLYRDDAMRNLGFALGYSYYGLSVEMDDFMRLFIDSGIADAFGGGSPTYIGMSGTELVRHVMGDRVSDYPKLVPGVRDSVPYWCGWILAYYQWYSRRPFSNIMQYVTMVEIASMYVLHEASEWQFVDAVNNIIRSKKPNTRLWEARTRCGLTAEELASRSRIPKEQIQKYESRELDINGATIDTIYNLAQALCVDMASLIEYDLRPTELILLDRKV